MSARWSQRPSRLLQIPKSDPYLAYCIDEAAEYLLTRIEMGSRPGYMDEMSQAEKDKKHQTSLDRAWARLKGKKK
jgi:hypothetical protein